jgi:type VI protein secretion system component VasF
MTEDEQERMRHLLKRTMRQFGDRADAELRRDLWPGMLKRLEARPAKVPWFDWALLAAAAMWLLFFPRAIPLLLYYL